MEARCRLQDKRPWYDAILLRSWSVAETKWDYVESRKVCFWNFEEIQDVGLEIHDYIDNDEFEVIWWYYIWDSWCHLIQEDDWFVDVFDEHETKYMLCGEHFELVYGWAKICSLDCSKACSKVPKRYDWLWTSICCKLWVRIGWIYRFRLGW